jgi:hypothetical protein
MPPRRTSKLQKIQETFSSKKKHPALQNMKFLNFFSNLWVIISPWILSRISYADPDPADQYPCGSGSGSSTLIITWNQGKFSEENQCKRIIVSCAGNATYGTEEETTSTEIYNYRYGTVNIFTNKTSTGGGRRIKILFFTHNTSR